MRCSASAGLLAILAIAIGAGACGGSSSNPAGLAPGSALTPTVNVAPPTQPAASPAGFALTSDAFANDGTIPTEYTCSGAGTSPPVTWSGAPSGTQSFALIVEDPDLPGGGTFDHWVVYDIPARTTLLPAGNAADEEIAGGGKQGKNSAGRNAWQPSCPPPGNQPHHYNFTLYAVDTLLNLDAGKSKADVRSAMTGHILAQAKLTGLFGR